MHKNMHKNLTLTLLAGLLAGASMLMAAEPGPGATPSSVASPVILDRSKPIQVDLWSGPPAADAMAKAGIDAKVVAEIRSEPSRAYSSPMFIGCILVGTTIQRPFASPCTQWYAPGASLDTTGGNCQYGFYDLKHLKEDLKEFSCVLESTKIRGSAKVDCGGKQPIEVVWEGNVTGNTITGNSAMLVDNGKRLERPFYGVLRNTSISGLDHLNAIYQFEREGLVIVIEVAGGKPVAALARKIVGNTLLEVDASGMTLTLEPAHCAGSSAKVGGTVVVDKKTIALGPVLLDPIGRGMKQLPPYSTVTRAYPNTDPVAKRWKEWMTAIYAGTQAVPSELATQSARDTLELDALPAPGPATAYTHKHMEALFIYAPWCDFLAVPGAVRYSFEVKPHEKKALPTFESNSPTASLRPVWKDLPAGQFVVVCTALDAAGKAIGQPQQWKLRGKRPAFADDGTMGKPIPDPIAWQVALRFPRTLAQTLYAHIPLYTRVMAAENNAINGRFISLIVKDPYKCLGRWEETPADRALAMNSANTFWRFLAKEVENPMAESTGYSEKGALNFCTVQDWGRTVMDEYETSRKPDRMDLLRESLIKLTRIQQPSGAWTLKHGVEYPYFTGELTFHLSAWLDCNGAAYALGLGRYRCLSGDGSFLDAEIKANHWVMRNSLRTGYWENLFQQGDPVANRPTAPQFLQDYLDYLLEHAPAEIANLAIAEDLARFAEDQFVHWSAPVHWLAPAPKIHGSGIWRIPETHIRMAIIYLQLHQQTGKPLYLAKAEAMFTSYMWNRDPVDGTTNMRFNRLIAEGDDPWFALRYLELRRQILAEKQIQNDPANSAVVVTLDNAVEGRERLVLHLDCQGGKVQRAIATTPTWHRLDIPFTQPGRLHHHEETQLFHPVDASKLTVGTNGVQGEVSVTLTPFAPGTAVTTRTFQLEAKPDARMITGRWTARESKGRLTGEIRAAVQAKPKRLHLEIAKAVTGGEAWQNWAMARFEVTDSRSATAGFSNNNSGWSATVETQDLKFTREAITANMKINVHWRGFVDDKAKAGEKMAAWKAGNLDWLAHWTLGHVGNSWTRGIYEPRFRPLPWPEHTRFPGPMNRDDNPFAFSKPWPEGTSIEEMEKQGGRLEYKTSFQPVVPGNYEYRFAGKRIGDVIAGTVTVKDPDGKERSSQCFGGVE